MIKYLMILILIGFIGCTVSRSMEVRSTATNIASVYGSGDADLNYKSNTTWRFLNGR